MATQAGPHGASYDTLSFISAYPPSACKLPAVFLILSNRHFYYFLIDRHTRSCTFVQRTHVFSRAAGHAWAIRPSILLVARRNRVPWSVISTNTATRPARIYAHNLRSLVPHPKPQPLNTLHTKLASLDAPSSSHRSSSQLSKFSTSCQSAPYSLSFCSSP